MDNWLVFRLPLHRSRKSMPIFSATFLDRLVMSSVWISCFALCSLVTADTDDEASEIFSHPVWIFSGDVSFGSDCGNSECRLTTTDFPFWITIWGKDNFRTTKRSGIENWKRIYVYWHRQVYSGSLAFYLSWKVFWRSSGFPLFISIAQFLCYTL